MKCTVCHVAQKGLAKLVCAASPVPLALCLPSFLWGQTHWCPCSGFIGPGGPWNVFPPLCVCLSPCLSCRSRISHLETSFLQRCSRTPTFKLDLTMLSQGFVISCVTLGTYLLCLSRLCCVSHLLTSYPRAWHNAEQMEGDQ